MSFWKMYTYNGSSRVVLRIEPKLPLVLFLYISISHLLIKHLTSQNDHRFIVSFPINNSMMVIFPSFFVNVYQRVYVSQLDTLGDLDMSRL